MTAPKFAYFPVTTAEQALLERVRRDDLTAMTQHLPALLDLIAEAKPSPEELEQALTQWSESEDDRLAGRFAQLEARLQARIDQALAEMEGRLSRRLDPDSPPQPPGPPPLAAPPEEAVLAYRLEGELVWGDSCAEFYRRVWTWLFDHRRVSTADLPLQTGKKRFDVALNPEHPTGKPFYKAAQIGGAFVETNLSKAMIQNRTQKYLAAFGVAYDVVLGDQP